MLRRILYTLIQAPTHYQQLKKIRQQTAIKPEQTTLDTWQQQGIKVIAFDFDGVLASHGEDAPNEQGKKLLDNACQLFPMDKIYILSNKPSNKRKQFFKQHYPKITFIQAKRKKPYPDGLNEIQQRSGCAYEQILLIDDRLLTGALAACLAGVQCQYIAKPAVDYAKRPMIETFFQSLRNIERLLF